MEGDREPSTRILLLAFSHMTCTRDPLAVGSELPRSCRNHSLLHTHTTILSPVCTFQTSACFFFNVSGSFFKCPSYFSTSIQFTPLFSFYLSLNVVFPSISWSIPGSLFFHFLLHCLKCTYHFILLSSRSS